MSDSPPPVVLKVSVVKVRGKKPKESDKVAVSFVVVIDAVEETCGC